jgi:hypothetical protein
MSVLSAMSSLLTSSAGMFFRRDEFFDDEIAIASPKRLAVGFFLLVAVFTLGTIILSVVVDSVFTSAFGLYSDYQVKFIELQIMYSKNGFSSILGVFIGFIIILAAISLIYVIGSQLSYWWARLFGGEGDRLSHYQVFLTAYLAFNFLLMITTPFVLGFFNVYSQKSAVVIFNIYLTKPNLLLILRMLVVAYALLLIYMVNVFYRGAKRLYNFETPLANGGTAIIALLFPIILANIVTGGWISFIQTAITGS